MADEKSEVEETEVVEEAENSDETVQIEIDPKELLDSVSLKLDGVDIKKTKRKSNKVKSKVKDVEELADNLFEEFSSFITKVSDVVEEKENKSIISTGIDLVDAILGGGFAIGALSIIVGQPGSGKSMLAIQTMGEGQRQFKGQMIGGFLDSEESTTSIRLANLGVRFPKINPYVDITVEKVFKFIEGMSVFKDKKDIIKEPSIIIWDSIANTLSEKERGTDNPNEVIGYKARLLSILIPKYVSMCAKHNICLLAVNQLRDNIKIGLFAPPPDLKFMSQSKNMPGGNVLKYNAFQLVEMKIKSAIAGEKAEKYGFEGIICKLKCVKNKLFPPNVEIEIVGSFMTGFSNFWTNYNFLATTNRLKTGAWNSMVSLPDNKFRTKDAPLLYKTDKDFKEHFDKNVKDGIQTEIIDKYSNIEVEVETEVESNEN